MSEKLGSAGLASGLDMAGLAVAARRAGLQVGWTPYRVETPSPQTGQRCLRLHPGIGHLALEGAGQVGVDVALHAGDCGPAAGAHLIRTGTAVDRAEDAGRAGWLVWVNIHWC
eukprot:s412_g17.t1